MGSTEFDEEALGYQWKLSLSVTGVSGFVEQTHFITHAIKDKTMNCSRITCILRHTLYTHCYTAKMYNRLKK